LNFYWLYICYSGWYESHILFSGAQKAIPAVDLVIADILEGLRVPGISTPLFSIPSWNAKSDKFMLVFFSTFCMQYLHDDGVLLIFHHEDPKWTKELFTYFFYYNVKVGHKPWTCMNPLRVTNPRNPNKRISLTTHVHHIFFLS
jgi:hypothetical protein